DVEEVIALTRQLHRRLDFREPQHLAAVELAEVDSFRDVAVRLGPVLADLEHQPRHEFEFALAQQIANPEQQAGTLLGRGPAPAFKRLERRVHRGLHMLFAGLLMQANQLRRLCRINGLNLVLRLDALSADDQVVLTAELAADFLDGSAHLARIFFLREIHHRFVDERPFVELNSRAAGGFNGCHKCTSIGYGCYGDQYGTPNFSTLDGYQPGTMPVLQGVQTAARSTGSNLAVKCRRNGASYDSFRP